MMKNSATVARTEVFEIENPALNIVTVTSDVNFLESDDGRTKIEIYSDSEEGRKLAENSVITIDGSTITVVVGKQNRGLKDLFGFSGGGVSVIVRVPNTAVIAVKSVSADIEVEVTSLNLEITTVSGDVLIRRNPTSRCNVKTVSGDVVTHTFSGCEYTLKSVSGDIKVNVAPGLEIEVDGKSISGDMTSEISLEGSSDSTFASAGAVMISASTVSGDFSLART